MKNLKGWIMEEPLGKKVGAPLKQGTAVDRHDERIIFFLFPLKNFSQI